MTAIENPPPITDAPEPPRRGLRSVVNGFALLAGGQIVGQAIGLAVLALVSRRIGPDALGVYQFSAGIVAYFTVPANFGITTLAIRDAARPRADPRKVAGETLALQLSLGVAMFVLCVLTAPLIAPDADTRSMVPLCALILLVNAINIEWLLQAWQKAGTVATTRLIGQVSYGIIMPLVLAGGIEGGRRYAIVNAVGLGISAIAAGWWVKRLIGGPLIRPALSDVWGRLRRSVPLGWSLVMIQIYYSVSTLLLGYLDSAREVAAFGVANRIPIAITALSTIWVIAMFPFVARGAEEDPERTRADIGKATGLAISIALPAAVGAAILDERMMTGLFGAEYASSATPFVLLMCSAALIAVSVNFGNALLAFGDERRYAVGVTCGAVLNIAVNAALIPSMGADGAAVATVSAELFVLVFMVSRARRVVGPVQLDVARLRGAVAATLIMAGTLVALGDGVRLPLTVAIGGVVYAVAAFATGALRPTDLRPRAF